MSQRSNLAFVIVLTFLSSTWLYFASAQSSSARSAREPASTINRAVTLVTNPLSLAPVRPTKKALNFSAGTDLVAPLISPIPTPSNIRVYLPLIFFTCPSGMICPSFSATPLSGTGTLTVTFTNYSTNATSYLWNFGDGTTSVLIHPTHVYSQPGSYTIFLTAYKGSLSKTATRSSYISVYQAVTPNFAATPLSGLKPLTVTFTNNSTGATGYLWKFGTGATSTVVNPSYGYTQTGVYTITLTALGPGGGNSLTRTHYITVYQPVNSNFSASPLTGTASLTVTFTNNSTGATGYLWKFGDAITSTVTSPIHAYAQAGIYTVTLTATGPGGSHTLTRTNYITITKVSISGLSIINNSPTPLNQPTMLTATLTAGSNVVYTWGFGDGVTGGGAVAGHTYPNLGVYTAIVTASNSVSVVMATTTVTITDQVISGLNTINSSPTTLNQETTLTARVITGSHVTYAWAFGDGAIGSGAIVSHTYPQVGVYTAEVTASNSVNAVITTTLVTVADEAIVGLNATNDGPTLLGQAITLTATINAGSNVTYHWDFGDGTQTADSGSVITHSYSTIGSYTVVVTTANSVSLITAMTTLTIIGLPDLAIGKNAPLDVVAGEPITYTLIITNSGTLTATNLVITDALPIRATYLEGGTPIGEVVSWTLASLSPGSSAIAQFVVTATETITNSDYRITADEGVAAAGQEVVVTRVYSPVLVDFMATPITGTVPLTISFANSSTNAISYEWNFGDSISSSEISPTHRYIQAGIYTVTLTASSGVFTNTLMRTHYITGYEPLLADFLASPLSGTVPLMVTFANSSTGVSSYLWNFGDGITTTVISPAHTYTQAGVYTVTLATSSLTDTLTRTTSITVYNLVRADFSATPLTGTMPLTVTFTNSSTYATAYTWDFGHGISQTFTSTLNLPPSSFTMTHVYTLPGVYTVTLTASDDRMTDALTRPIYIEGFGADFTAMPQIGPAPLQVTFTDILSGRIESRLWDFGDGITQTATTEISATHLYTQVGVYTPSLTIIRAGYVYTQTKSAYVTARGVQFNASPPTGFSPLIVTFTDIVSAPAMYRAWDFDDGSVPFITTGITETATSLTTTHTYTQTGAYSVTLTIVREGYSYTQTVPNLVLVAQAACAITGTQTTWWDSHFFYRQSITLIVAQPLNYTPGVTQVLSLTLDTQTLITNGLVLPGGEDLRVIYHDSNGWRDLPRQIEGLNTANTTVLFPLQATITSTDTDYYLYYGHVAPGAPSELYPQVESGSVLTTTGSGTFIPTVIFTASVYTGLAPLEITFTNLTTPTDGIASYSWDFGDGDTSSDFAPSHTYTDPGLYTVTLTAMTTEGLTVSNTWFAAIQIPGVDATAEATADLGEVEAPVTNAVICAGVSVPQTFISADADLTITFPPGAVQETIVITHTPQTNPYNNGSELAFFAMTATTLNGVPVTVLNGEMVFSLHYNITGQPEWLERSIAAFGWNETTQAWEYLPTTLDTTANLVHFRSQQFSRFAVVITGLGSAQGNIPAAANNSLPSTVSAAQSDLFSGAATWSYPLHVPPGRNGLQPDLTISYNSHLADAYQTSFQKSGWLGLGFSLEPGYVELNVSYLLYEDIDNNGCTEQAPADFEAYLVLNGARTKLVRQGNWFPEGEESNLVANFHLQQDNFLRVQLMRGGAGANTDLQLLVNGSLKSLANLYWLVTTKEGTIYRFGDTQDSTEVQLAVMNKCTAYPIPDQRWMSYPGRAYLNKLTDLYDNDMIFTYDREFATVTLYNFGETRPGRQFNPSVRLTSIDYTDATRRVTFKYQDGRLDKPSSEISKLPRSYYYYPMWLWKIEMSVNGDDFLRYEFSYDHITFHPLGGSTSVPVLKMITIEGEEEALAARTSFEYYDNWWDPRKGRLYQINNGYGGITTFNYNLLDKRVNEIRIEAPDTEPIIREFIKTGSSGQRDIWVWNGGWTSPETVTHYVFHNPYNWLDPFNTNLPPLTGQLTQIEIFDPDQVSIASFGLHEEPFSYRAPLQATCSEYTVRATSTGPTSLETHFVAPQKVTTLYNDDCTSANGIAVEYQYDAYGNMETMIERGDPDTDDDDRYTQTEYEDPDNGVLNRPQVQQIEDTNEAVLAKTSYKYNTEDGAVEEVEITGVDFVNGVDLVSIIHYDDHGNVAWTKDGGSHRTEFTDYDGDNVYPERIEYPTVNGATLSTETSYDPRWGTVAETTGFNGDTTTYTYDPFGRPKQVTDPVATTRYIYDDDDDGLTVQTIQAYNTLNSYQTWARYNGLGQLWQTEAKGDSVKIKVNYDYDSLGRLKRTSVPYIGSASQWSETEYDLLGRPKTILQPDGSSRSFAYDSWQQVTLTDEMERETVYQQDAFGHTHQVIQDWEGDRTTTYNYDPLGNLTKMIDADVNSTEIVYDSLGRVIFRNDPDMGTWLYTYDNAGNLATQTDARDETIGFTYDALNRLTGKDYGNNGSAEVTYLYDSLADGNEGRGRRTGMTDASGSTTWRYDLSGWLLAEIKTIGDTTYTTGYTYDTLNRVQTMTYPDGEIVTYGYSDGGQVYNLTSSNGDTYLQSANYNALGQPTTFTLGDGIIQTDLTYYLSGANALALQSIVAENQAGQTLLDLTYSNYYADGSLKQLITTIGINSPTNLNLTYAYDTLGWLTGVTDSSNSGLTFNYGYSMLGNLTSKNGLNFVYNGPSRHAPSQVGSIHFNYDDNGNRRQRYDGTNTLTYHYDPENRLTEVEDDIAPRISYTYDGTGRRVQHDINGYESRFVNEAYELVQQGEWSTPQPIFGENSYNQYSPDLTSDTTGTLYLVWAEDSTLYDKLGQIRYARRLPGGGWSPSFLVRDGAVHNDLAAETRPVIAVNPDGSNIYIAWQELITTTFDHEIYAASQAAGWADTLVATTLVDGGPPNPTLAAGPNGTYLAWVSYHDDTDETVVHVNQAGPSGWTEMYQTNALIGGDQYAPALAADSQGNVYLAYLEAGNLYVVHKSGSSWGSPYLIGQNTSSAPTLAIDSQDNLLVFWNRYLSKRIAATQTWEEPVEDGLSDTFTDLTLRDDVPEWVGIRNCDCANNAVNSNNGTIVGWDDRINHSTSASLTVGPDGALVAIWQAERDTNNAPGRLFISIYKPGTDVVKHYYVGGQRLATRVNELLYYYLSDHLGSATVIADAEGREVGQVVYEPYGQIVNSTLPPDVTDRLFTGQRYEDTIGLYDYNARFYDPQIGQFIQPDSLVAEPGNPMAWNRYAYVYNSPVNYTDSSGHVIDTLFDALALASDASGCLEDSDALSCYMLPLDAVFLAVPFATAGGFGDDALRAARGAENAEDVAHNFVWDANVNRWRDGQGRFAKPPDVLDRSSLRWSQESISGDVYWPSVDARISVSDVVRRLKEGEIYQGEPLLVFRKTPAMNDWPMKVHPKGYTGNWANLEDGVIYSINNRTLTVFTAAKIDQIPVRWATQRQIIAYSYQYSTRTYGKFMKFRYY